MHPIFTPIHVLNIISYLIPSYTHYPYHLPLFIDSFKLSHGPIFDFMNFHFQFSTHNSDLKSKLCKAHLETY